MATGEDGGGEWGVECSYGGFGSLVGCVDEGSEEVEGETLDEWVVDGDDGGVDDAGVGAVDADMAG